MRTGRRMRIERPFNPLSKQNLGTSVADALLARPLETLPIKDMFDGAGIYAIYYLGDFPAYRPIAERNGNGDPTWPIYVGKAEPKGARKGLYSVDAPVGRVLRSRLNEHSRSIEQASNLSISDFLCRLLVVDDIWIPLGESLLIERFRPIWNTVVDGFGNHDPGGGRRQQAPSPWDIIHPGRRWVKSLSGAGHEEEHILERLQRHFERELA